MKLQACLYKDRLGNTSLGVACTLQFDIPVVRWVMNLKGKKVEYRDVTFPDVSFGNKLDTDLL